jgi:hypothetical protein
MEPFGLGLQPLLEVGTAVIGQTIDFDIEF